MHAGLAMMHVHADVHAGQRRVGKGRRVHRRNDHADNLSTRLKGTVGKGAHEAGAPSSIDDGLAATSERLAQLVCCCEVLVMDRVGRTAENTNGLHGSEYTGRLACEGRGAVPFPRTRSAGPRRVKKHLAVLCVSTQIRIVSEGEGGA